MIMVGFSILKQTSQDQEKREPIQMQTHVFAQAQHPARATLVVNKNNKKQEENNTPEFLSSVGRPDPCHPKRSSCRDDAPPPQGPQSREDREPFWQR